MAQKSNPNRIRGVNLKGRLLIIVSLLCGWDALGIPVVCLGHLTGMAPTFFKTKTKRLFKYST
ncbi:hypothetical protein D0T87_01885 [Bacteroides sp. 51]|nr:hypothetical protein [Bacteroides sp. 51]